MKLDSKKSKAAVKNSAVKQKKVKAKAANPAKAPKVKKTLNTKKAQKVNNKPKVKGKKKLSTKLILIPVFIVGFVSVISSGLSLKNLSKVNDAASQIVDTSMVGTEMLNDIEMETVNIHTLALSHIISTDLSSMIDIVSEVRNHEEKLKQLLDDYNPYVTLETKRNYRIICENYTSLVKECGNVMAYSAAGKNEEAYKTANGSIAKYTNNIEKAISSMREYVNSVTQEERKSLESTYRASVVTCTFTIAVSIIALLFVVFAVVTMVIKPLLRTQKEINGIIVNIDNKKGDLTQRVTPINNAEVDAVGKGINVFMTKLQAIFKAVVTNSARMERVVDDVRQSVQTSNSSVSDLSALTEELSATMQDISENASVINTNTDNVAKEVELIAEKTDELTGYTRDMKAHAQSMESVARTNMESTDRKVSEILEVLQKAIEDSNSVKQVNSLTNDILNIASQTNLLALNASIEELQLKAVVTINNNDQIETKYCEIGEQVRVVAQTVKDKKFSHWTFNGTPICYSSPYTFTVYGDTTIEAVYVDAGEEVTPQAAMLCSVSYNKSTQTIKYTAKRSVPEGCKIVKHGMILTSKPAWEALYKDNQEAFKLEADRIITKVATTTGLAGNYSVSVKCTKPNIWYAKGYVVYTDKNGEEQTVYSDVVSYEVK